jgi:glycine cleavage system aminomethyltransferase T
MNKSPFSVVHQQLDANFGVFDGWSLPADFGDIDSESRALSESCAVVDLCSFGRIQISGKSAKETINTIFSTENGVIAQDSWVWAKPVGSDFETPCRIFRLNGSYTLLTQPDQTEPLFQWVESGAKEGVSVTNVTNKTAMLGLYGPKAFESMQGVLPFEIDHLDRGDAEKMSFMMMGFTLLRGSWLNADGLELICPAAAGPIAAGAVAKYRHKHNITPAGMNSLQASMRKMDRPI